MTEEIARTSFTDLEDFMYRTRFMCRLYMVDPRPVNIESITTVSPGDLRVCTTAILLRETLTDGS